MYMQCKYNDYTLSTASSSKLASGNNKIVFNPSLHIFTASSTFNARLPTAAPGDAANPWPSASFSMPCKPVTTSVY